MIVKLGDNYQLQSKKTHKNLGTYPTRAGAVKREHQVEYFKHLGTDNEEEPLELAEFTPEDVSHENEGNYHTYRYPGGYLQVKHIPERKALKVLYVNDQHEDLGMKNLLTLKSRLKQDFPNVTTIKGVRRTGLTPGDVERKLSNTLPPGVKRIGYTTTRNQGNSVLGRVVDPNDGVAVSNEEKEEWEQLPKTVHNRTEYKSNKGRHLVIRHSVEYVKQKNQRIPNKTRNHFIADIDSTPLHYSRVIGEDPIKIAKGAQKASRAINKLTGITYRYPQEINLPKEGGLSNIPAGVIPGASKDKKPAKGKKAIGYSNTLPPGIVSLGLNGYTKPSNPNPKEQLTMGTKRNKTGLPPGVKKLVMSDTPRGDKASKYKTGDRVLFTEAYDPTGAGLHNHLHGHKGTVQSSQYKHSLRSGVVKIKLDEPVNGKQYHTASDMHGTGGIEKIQEPTIDTSNDLPRGGKKITLASADDLWGSFDPDQAASDLGMLTEDPKPKGAKNKPAAPTKTNTRAPRKTRSSTDVRKFIKGLRPGANVISVAYTQHLHNEPTEDQKTPKLRKKHRLTDQPTKEIYPKGVKSETVGRFLIGFNYANAKNKELQEQGSDEVFEPGPMWGGKGIHDPEHKGLLKHADTGREYLYLRSKVHPKTLLPRHDFNAYTDLHTGNLLTPEQVKDLKENLMSKPGEVKPGKIHLRVIPTEHLYAAKGSKAHGWQYLNKGDTK